MDRNFELNFLIVKFLREGVCPEAANILEQALNKDGKAVPPRLDYKGNKHQQTLDQLERQFPEVGPNHLLDICQRLENRSLLSLPRPPPKLSLSFKPIQYLQRSQLGLQPSTHYFFNSLYKKLHLLRRTVGHLSAVFCLLFDKTGQYVFTGADDLLVKMWSTSTGRLYFTFRGASGEISDMAISEDNNLLAAGSTDKIIRVWCLTSAAPVAVLAKHTGNITALHFCPANISGVPPYLAATSGDGTVSFWKYSYKSDKHKRPVFDSEPTRYHEKMRPGGAQMICASFSPGGLFFATGSADHHVRVYMMDGKEGPVKVLEQEAHSERVDSLQWANNPTCRFASGSKDGTARIWSYNAGEWHSVPLVMKSEDGRTMYYSNHRQCEEQIRVTMTTWTADDKMVVTAISDSSLLVWDSKTCDLLYRLKGHKDEVYVLEPHPTRPDIVLSGAHDGSIIVWETTTQKILFRYQNDIDGQGHGAIYDAKWCPGSMRIAASDSHGHVLIFGTESDEPYKKCPEEMFFHSDYRPLLRDTAHHVVDEQTQCAPHLLPPPFLVDMEGNPYPADIQRLVPGREHLSDQEAMVPDLAEPEQSPRHRSGESAGVARTAARTAASNIDQLIAELAATTPREVAGPNVSGENLLDAISEHSYASPGRRPSAREPNNQRTGALVPAPASQELTRSIWRKRELVGSHLYTSAKSDRATQKDTGIQERIYYKLELAKKRNRVVQIESRHQGIERIIGSRRSGRGGRTRGARSGGTRGVRPTASTRRLAASRGNESQETEEGQEDEEEEVQADINEESPSDDSLDESDLESGDSSSSNSTVYSDWGANNLTPPQRTARKSGRVTGSSKPASSDEASHADNSLADNSLNEPSVAAKPGPSRSVKNNRKKHYSFNPTQMDDIPPEYLPSGWLAQFVPNKSPYFPQMGDEVMYIKQGHMGYINLVKNRASYKLNMREQQWLQRDDIKDIELVKVIGMKHEIRPPRLCCLKLAIVHPEDGTLTGDNFSIKYHDMNDVVDFLVLKHNYEASVQVQWKPDDRYRCQIEDSWWFGSVVEVAPFDDRVPDSPFLSIKCLWDSGEEERLSPWDLDPVHQGDPGFEKTANSQPVTREEIERFLYQPMAEEWRGLDNRRECQRISEGLAGVMALAIAEPFNYPVDLTCYPDYMLEIEYPMDLNLIKSRLDNQFYRRTTAIQFDVRYIATNTESYNRPNTDIVKNARIVTDLILRIIQDTNLTDVNGEYHRLMDNFSWEDTQQPGTKKTTVKPEKRSRQKSVSESPVNPKQWKHDCKDLLNKMFQHQDSEPFREPVSEIDFPDYARIVATPMDLSQIRETLGVGEYKTPLEFKDEVELIFSNSMRYNTDRKSEIARMTRRFKAFFLDEIQAVIQDWRSTNRRLNFLKKKGSTPNSTPRKTGGSVRKRRRRAEIEPEESDEDPGEGTSRPNQRRTKPIKYDEGSTEDDSSDDEEERRPRRNVKRPERFCEDDSEDEQAGSSSRGKRNLNMSLSDAETRRDKGKGVSTKALSRKSVRTSTPRRDHSPNSSEEEKPVKKGGKKSSKAAYERVEEEVEERGEPSKRDRRKKAEAEEESDDDVPISRRRNVITTPRKKSISRNGVKAVIGETSETPEEAEEEFTEELTEEETEEPTQESSEDEDYGEERTSQKKRATKRMRSAERNEMPRPRRQATVRALSRFTASDSEEFTEEPRRRNRRENGDTGGSSRRDNGGIGGSSRRGDSGGGSSRRNNGGGGSKRGREGRRAPNSSAYQTGNVTISAADSSTDPKRDRNLRIANTETETDDEPLVQPSPRARRSEMEGPRHSRDEGRVHRGGARPDYNEEDQMEEGSRKRKRKVKSVRIQNYSDDNSREIGDNAAPAPAEQDDDDHARFSGVASGSSKRKITKPIRLQDYSNDELIREVSRKTAKKKAKKRFDGSEEDTGDGRDNGEKRKRKDVRYKEESEPEERSRGKKKKNRDFEERSSGSRRLQAEPNYRDESVSEDEDDRIPYNKTRHIPPATADEPENRRGKKSRGARDSVQPRARESLQEENEESAESDFGRRKRSRRESQRTAAGSSERPMRNAAAGPSERPMRNAAAAGSSERPQRNAAGPNRYLESSDEDDMPKRSHRVVAKRSRAESHDSDSGESSGEEEARGSGGGVSSRGRIRRPNPRLMD